MIQIKITIYHLILKCKIINSLLSTFKSKNKKNNINKYNFLGEIIITKFKNKKKIMFFKNNQINHTKTGFLNK